VNEHPKSREYEDLLEENESSVEDVYPIDDMDLAYLDTGITEDRWVQRFAATGSIELDPDWF